MDSAHFEANASPHPHPALARPPLLTCSRLATVTMVVRWSGRTSYPRMRCVSEKESQAGENWGGEEEAGKDRCATLLLVGGMGELGAGAVLLSRSGAARQLRGAGPLLVPLLLLLPSPCCCCWCWCCACCQGRGAAQRCLWRLRSGVGGAEGREGARDCMPAQEAASWRGQPGYR